MLVLLIGFFVGMFVGNFNGIYIGVSVIIDAVIAAGDSVGTSVVTDMDTYVGIRFSVSVMNPLQCDSRSGSEEMVFPYQHQIFTLSHLRSNKLC